MAGIGPESTKARPDGLPRCRRCAPRKRPWAPRIARGEACGRGLRATSSASGTLHPWCSTWNARETQQVAASSTGAPSRGVPRGTPARAATERTGSARLFIRAGRSGAMGRRWPGLLEAWNQRINLSGQSGRAGHRTPAAARVRGSGPCSPGSRQHRGSGVGRGDSGAPDRAVPAGHPGGPGGVTPAAPPFPARGSEGAGPGERGPSARPDRDPGPAALRGGRGPGPGEAGAGSPRHAALESTWRLARGRDQPRSWDAQRWRGPLGVGWRSTRRRTAPNGGSGSPGADP